MKKITLKNIQDHSSNMVYSFSKPFLEIIKNKLKGYNGTTKERLKSFLSDVQTCGCWGGMIKKFIYNEDCKEFYIKHLDDLEEYIEKFEERFGERKSTPRYTFVVWSAFEEFCNDIENNIFDKE
jgi:hypothetical protein